MATVQEELQETRRGKEQEELDLILDVVPDNVIEALRGRDDHRPGRTRRETLSYARAGVVGGVGVEERLGKPRRLRWATSLQKCFGVDPLVDRNGRRMR